MSSLVAKARDALANSKALQDAYGAVSVAASQAASQLGKAASDAAVKTIQNAAGQAADKIPGAAVATGGRKSKKSTPPSQCGCSGGTLGGCLTCGGKLGSSSKPKSGGKKKKRSKSRKSRSKSRSRK